MTRAVKIVDAATEAAKPVVAAGQIAAPVQAAPSPVRIASLDGQAAQFAGLNPREAPFQVVLPSQAPELVWDPANGDLIAGADVIAYRMAKDDLPSAVDRAAAARTLKLLAAKSPQAIRVLPNDKLHRKDAKVTVEIGGIANRALVLFNIAGDGTVQLLYPIASDPVIVRAAEYRLPVQVREPFGSDLVVAITSEQPMPMLEQALRSVNQRRSALAALKIVERYRPIDGRIGATGIFTAP